MTGPQGNQDPQDPQPQRQQGQGGSTGTGEGGNSPQSPKPGQGPDNSPDAPDQTDFDLDEILQNKDVISEIDRRVTQAVHTAEKRMLERVEKAKREAERKAEEKKLLEDQKYQELAETKSREAQEAMAKLEQYERRQNVVTLIDKMQSEAAERGDAFVLKPKIRELFMSLPGELKDVQEAVNAYKDEFHRAVEEAVNARLKNPSPPKGSGDNGGKSKYPSKRSEFKSVSQKVAFVKEFGQDAWEKLDN